MGVVCIATGSRTSGAGEANQSATLAQLDGLQAGVAHWAKDHGTKEAGRVEQVKLNQSATLAQLDGLQAGVAHWAKDHGLRWPEMGHCSALIKRTRTPPPCYKHWDFNTRDTHTATGQLSFSGYPEHKTGLYSEGDARKTICCRGDLPESNSMAGGCNDTEGLPLPYNHTFISMQPFLFTP
ncbi:unnamed protein product [Lota lota]